METITGVKKVLIDKVKPGTRGYIGHAFGCRFGGTDITIVCSDQAEAEQVFNHIIPEEAIDKDKMYKVAVMQADDVSVKKPEEKERYLSAIEAAHIDAWEAISKLQYEQHHYLEARGFKIEPIECDGEYLGHTYSIEDEIFTGEEEALEWLEEHGDES